VDFAQFLRVLLRRWVIVLVGLMVSAGAAFGVYKVVPRSYEATSQVVLLLGPNASSPEVKGSPFIYVPNGLNTLAEVLTLIPNTPEFRASMVSAGFDSSYTIDLERQSPIVTFTVVSSDPTSTLRTRAELMRRFESDLNRVQREERVPAWQLAHMRVLEASDYVAVRPGDTFRVAAASGAGCVVLTLLVIAFVERRSTRKPRRAGAETAEADEGTGETTCGETPHGFGIGAGDQGDLSPGVVSPAPV
jgi:capsular polysaccharide biosynthesis protein